MADWAIEAMEAGKAVLCEKPAGRGSGDTVRLVETAERTGQLFQVGYCWRYAPSVDKMQEVLNPGSLGKVLQVRAHAGCSHGEADTDHMRQSGRHRRRALRHRLPHDRPLLLHFGMPIGQRPDHQVRRRDGPSLARGCRRRDPQLRRQDVTIDFMSWDPLPWTESWDITAYGTEGVMHSRPLPASYKIYSSGKNGHQEGRVLRSEWQPI